MQPSLCQLRKSVAVCSELIAAVQSSRGLKLIANLDANCISVTITLGEEISKRKVSHLSVQIPYLLEPVSGQNPIGDAFADITERLRSFGSLRIKSAAS